MKEKLKYACIGAGKIAAKKHLPGYAAAGGVELCAICDSDLTAAGALADNYSIPLVYTDYMKMLNELKPDIVSVCTPNDLHMRITCDALKAGAHVHCEKPLALNGAEAETIVQTEALTGRSVMLGLNKRYLPETVLAQKLRAEGYFGEIYHIRCGWRRNCGIPGIGTWFTCRSRSGGGAMIDLGVHYLDLAMSFLDYPVIEAVSGAAYGCFAGDRSRVRTGYCSSTGGVFDVEDTAVGMLRAAGGATVDFEFSWAGNIEGERRFLEVLGSKGGLSMKDDQLTLFCQKAGAYFEHKPDMASFTGGLNECAHFTDCVRRGVKPVTTAWQGLYMMRIIDAFYSSAALRTEVRPERGGLDSSGIRGNAG